MPAIPLVVEGILGGVAGKELRAELLPRHPGVKNVHQRKMRAVRPG
ncbi:MAG: hypothetical protein LUC93_01760 [Planctomycetaceae bacterium]|nr:hypothetical protein [Planctomycetaceae bacterium]